MGKVREDDTMKKESWTGTGTARSEYQKGAKHCKGTSHLTSIAANRQRAESELAGKVARASVRRSNRGDRAAADRQRHRERASPAQLALDGGVAAHRARKLPHDEQAETRAACFHPERVFQALE